MAPPRSSTRFPSPWQRARPSGLPASPDRASRRCCASLRGSMRSGAAGFRLPARRCGAGGSRMRCRWYSRIHTGRFTRATASTVPWPSRSRSTASAAPRPGSHRRSPRWGSSVAIARALILSPSVLLLDEPTAALDVSVQAEILALLQRLRQERGLTYVLVSHDLAVIAELCSRVAVMREGRIVEELAVEDLRAGRARHPYTAALIDASRGYRRQSSSALAP